MLNHGICLATVITRIGASLGLQMKFKTLFMSGHDLLGTLFKYVQAILGSWGFEF